MLCLLGAVCGGHDMADDIKLRMGFLLVLKRPRRIIGREDDVGGIGSISMRMH